MRKHKWYHFMATVPLTMPYRFVKRWWGTEVQYRDIYCIICKRIVRTNYKEEK